MDRTRTVAAMLHCVITGVLISSAGLAEDVTIGERTFHVAPGFELDLVAGPDLAERPIAVSFDEQGRLYVTDSAGMSDRATEQVRTKPHRMRRLTDVDGDGVFDESTLFAEHLMFPEGCMYYDGSVYVAAPPEIWKLTDTDGDGVSDERSVWFDGTTLTGCGNDLHGPYPGPDGWFYWCKGAFAEQNWTVNDQPFSTRSSHIFRALPDGSRMEPVLTGGMDNPVNVAFLPNGDRFLSCTFFQHPANGQRDGLIHSVYGGVYGKKHDSIYEHAMTGDVMPVMTHMGAAAPCGLIAVDQGEYLFGEEQVGRTLFACYFNLHKVVQHELVASGSTYTTVDRDLVSSDHPDFHPTDVQQAPDGSLLIVDTGGWYKVCCPTSQLAKPDVLGAIYRLRRTGQPAVADPLGSQLTWDRMDAGQLIELLADDRRFVRDRAINRLRKLGVLAMPALSNALQHETSPIRATVFRVLSGIDLPEARELAGRHAVRPNDTLRNAALYQFSLWRDPQGFDLAARSVAEADEHSARLAANVLGRLGDRRATSLLLQALEGRGRMPVESDETGSPRNPAVRVREHSLIHALIEIGDAEGTRTGLTSTDPQVIRGTLVALDQMSGDHLDAATLLPFLRHADVRVARTAAWVVGHHAEWGSELVAFYREELVRSTVVQADQLPDNVAQQLSEQLADQLARLAGSGAIQDLLQTTLLNGTDSQRIIALRAITRSGLSTYPEGWLLQTAHALTQLQADHLADAVAEIRQWPLPKDDHPELNAALFHIGRAPSADASLRLDALALAGRLKEVDAPLFRWLMEALVSDPQRGLRSAAARVLGHAVLSAEQQNELVSAVAVVGPFELPVLLPAFTAGTEDLGRHLITALPESPGFRGLRVDLLKAWLDKYPPTIQESALPLLRQLNPSVEQQTAQLESLLASLPPGDARRGHEIFNSAQAKCITCHTRGYHGGRLGPDLTRIGKVRNTRDLVEAVIFPSASLVRGYEPVTVVLNQGDVVNGIVAGESQAEIVLALDADKRRHIPRTEIDEIVPASVSLMPAGIDKILTAKDIADLVAFLQQD